ncbi:MAG: methyltransferase [Tepidiformaceae bacterium]
MAETTGRPSARLREMIDGFQVSQAIHAAATLGVADVIGEGRRSAAEIAAKTGADADALYRLLRALASVGVFDEDGDRRFALTDLGECLRSDALEPQGDWARQIGQPYYWEAWDHLLFSIRTGANAFPHLHDGMSVWKWRANHPGESAIFDQAMMGISRSVASRVLEAYNFGQFAKVVDVGGGNGAFLAALLAKHPSTYGTVFDQPHVVVRATTTFESAGVAARAKALGGSFFESVPSGADAYLLKAVLHDWEDGECVRILTAVREACGTARLLVIEHVVDEPNTDRRSKFSDLNMLVMPGGRERTAAEWRTLFESAGFALRGITPAEGAPSVIEGAVR